MSETTCNLQLIFTGVAPFTSALDTVETGAWLPLPELAYVQVIKQRAKQREFGDNEDLAKIRG